MRRAAVWACALGIAVIIGLCPTGYFAVSPGPVESLGSIVMVENQAQPEKSVYMVSIAAESASVYRIFLAGFSPRTELWSKKQVLGGRTLDQYQQDNQALMASSIETSIHVALAECGFEVRTGTPPVRVSVAPGEVVGPSAGLAFALEIYARVSSEVSLSPRPVVATGVLDKNGRVLPVGGISQKAIACADQGAAVFIVPRANLAEALKHSGDMRVLGVSSFTEAVEILKAAPPFLDTSFFR